jgi:hypothetical protein
MLRIEASKLFEMSSRGEIGSVRVRIVGRNDVTVCVEIDVLSSGYNGFDVHWGSFRCWWLLLDVRRSGYFAEARLN